MHFGSRQWSSRWTFVNCGCTRSIVKQVKMGKSQKVPRRMHQLPSKHSPSRQAQGYTRRRSKRCPPARTLLGAALEQ